MVKIVNSKFFFNEKMPQDKNYINKILAKTVKL